MVHAVSGDWRVAAEDIRQYSGDAKEYDSYCTSHLSSFSDNPTATLALLFAAAEWADRVGDSSAPVRKNAAVMAFDQYWVRGLLWRMESLQFKADLYRLADRPDKDDMEVYCVRLMKRTYDENISPYESVNEEDRILFEIFYSTAVERLGRDGRTLDVLWDKNTLYDTSKRRVFMNRDDLFLSELLRLPPESSAFNWLAQHGSHIGPLSEDEQAKIENVRSILLRLLDQMAANNASLQRTRRKGMFDVRSNILEKNEVPPKPIRRLTIEDIEKLPPYDPVQANKEYRDLTADPPLPKPGEEAKPKPPEEKLVPYLKDSLNKDPKANGLGLSIEALTDVTRAELGPLPFPLPVRLSSLEGARHPQPPPPGMMSDRAKTQITYKPRRVLMSYLKKQAGRDIPDNYGKIDAPLMIYDSQREYQAHKDNKAECYFLIGRNLEHAQRLLLEDPIQIRRSGIGLAEVAAQFVWQDLKDKPLAAAIMDLYVMPYLHLGDKRRENHLSKHHLLGSATATYTFCEFPDKLLLAAEEACRESSDQNGQDARRFCIAKALVQLKKADEAIKTLEQVTDPSLVNGAKGYIATIKKEHGLP